MGLSPAFVQGSFAQDLKAVWNGVELRVSSPRLNFITGRGFDQLRNGRAVAYDIQISLHREGVPARRNVQRFAISYDIWEERYRVIRLARDKQERKSQSNLARDSAEGWCVDNTTLSTDGIDPNSPVMVHLEVRPQEARDAADTPNESALSLAALIDLFTKPRPAQQRWTAQTGPLRLNDIRARAN